MYTVSALGGPEGSGFLHTTQNATQFKTYGFFIDLLISGMFHLIFQATIDHGTQNHGRIREDAALLLLYHHYFHLSSLEVGKYPRVRMLQEIRRSVQL